MEMLVSLEPVQCCRCHRWTVRLFGIVPGKKLEMQSGTVFALKKDAMKHAKQLAKRYEAEYNEVKR